MDILWTFIGRTIDLEGFQTFCFLNWKASQTYQRFQICKQTFMGLNAVRISNFISLHTVTHTNMLF